MDSDADAEDGEAVCEDRCIMIQLMHGDCLERMREIPDGSVDMIFADLPFGTTDCAWDVVIPLAPMWEQFHRVAKENAAIVLFSDEPFTCQLISSNIKEFRYKWIWDKMKGSNFANAKKMPMKSHVEICVFYKKLPTYNPQWWYSKPYRTRARMRAKDVDVLANGGAVKKYRPSTESRDDKRYPLSIIKVPRDTDRIHPTQKPVKLLEYLIRTYTREGDVVLDPCMGSGSTGLAAANTGRSFIGIELDDEYYDMALGRIESYAGQMRMEGM